MTRTHTIGPRLGRGYYAEVFAYGEGKVIKLFDDGRDMESANHEARVTAVARESGIPAPKVYEVVTVNDRVGIVMERIDGENMIQWGTSLPLARPYRRQADGPPPGGHALQQGVGHSPAT